MAVVDGFLLKKGAKNTLSWKKRWFVLESNGIAKYFKVRQDCSVRFHPTGRQARVNGLSLTVRRHHQSFGNRLIIRSSILAHIVFNVLVDVVTGDRIWHLRAYSKEDMDKWVQTLLHVILWSLLHATYCSALTHCQQTQIAAFTQICVKSPLNECLSKAEVFKNGGDWFFSRPLIHCSVLCCSV